MNPKQKREGGRFAPSARPRSLELLNEIEANIREGWSINKAIKMAGGSYKQTLEWSKLYPEWTGPFRLAEERRRCS